MDHTLPNHRLPIHDFMDERKIERAAAALRGLHSDKGQKFLVAGICHMSAQKAWEVLRGIDLEPCGAPHHMIMPRGQSARCSTAIQQNTLHCAHGSQLPLQQALVTAVLLGVIPEDVLQEYVRARTIQKEVVLGADDLLTSGYAIVTRGKEDERSQAHLQRMGLPVIGVTPADVRSWMCGKQEMSGQPIIAIIIDVIAKLEERFPVLTEQIA